MRMPFFDIGFSFRCYLKVVFGAWMTFYGAVFDFRFSGT